MTRNNNNSNNWVENGIELEAFSEQKIGEKARELGETAKTVLEEAKRLGWSSEYLLWHWKKEERIKQQIKD